MGKFLEKWKNLKILEWLKKCKGWKIPNPFKNIKGLKMPKAIRDIMRWRLWRLRAVRLGLVGVLAVALIVGVVLICLSGDGGETANGRYTYKTYTSALAQNWNPHSWTTSADKTALDYLSMPFCTVSIKDSKTGEHQWVYEMATSIRDVTAENRDDLEKYQVNLPAGVSLESVSEGYVFEIKLNRNAKWQNGAAINAASYVYSMKQLLSADLKNFRASRYLYGDEAVAGGHSYSVSGAPIYKPMVAPYQMEGDYSYDLDAGIKKGQVFVHLETEQMTLYPYTLVAFNENYKLGMDKELKELAKDTNTEGYVPVTKENKKILEKLVKKIAPLFGIEYSKELLMEILWVFDGEYGQKAAFEEAVGLYAKGEYTLHYVTNNRVTLDDFRSFCTTNWLVHEGTYEDAVKEENGGKVCDYGTSLETTMSYGPYKLESVSDSEMVLVQNENWYGWKKQEDGKLLSYTNFEVDGQKRQQFQTTRIEMKVMDGYDARDAFMAGGLSQLGLVAKDTQKYIGSKQLVSASMPQVKSLFFNTNLTALQAMKDGSKNAVVLYSEEFRKALSLAIDRSALAMEVVGGQPAYGLFSDRQYYDVINNPGESYRISKAGMKALCRLYGLSYGKNAQYLTLEDAYSSITGVNMEQAKALMQLACNKLAIAGLYKAGEKIVIPVAWSAGSVGFEAKAVAEKISAFMNAAAEDSGFGEIQFVPVGSVKDTTKAVAEGKYPAGFGAWGGGVSQMFEAMQLYMDPDKYALQEGACWDPKKEELTLTIDGETMTLTYQQWANTLVGDGAYAQVNNEVKLEVLSYLEEAFLQKYYRIPLYTDGAASLMSYQVSFYTDAYSPAYGFGGLRLMKYHYDDAQWAEFLEENDGKLNYLPEEE